MFVSACTVIYYLYCSSYLNVYIIQIFFSLELLLNTQRSVLSDTRLLQSTNLLYLK